MRTLQSARILATVAALFASSWDLIAVAKPAFTRRIPHQSFSCSTCHDGATSRETLNNFAKDFRGYGEQWTDSLCRQDSDGDGATNGQELLDPECSWMLGDDMRLGQATKPGDAQDVPPLDTTVDEAEDERGGVPESEADSVSGGETGAASREMVAPDITENLNGGDPGAVSELIAGGSALPSDVPEDGATIEFGRDLGEARTLPMAMSSAGRDRHTPTIALRFWRVAKRRPPSLALLC